MKAPRPPHIPRKFFSAVRRADFDESAAYLGIMVRSEAERYPGRDDILTVFMASHLACALDLAGYLDMNIMIPIEPVVEKELSRWHSEYPDAENWEWVLSRRCIHTICVLNGLIPEGENGLIPDSLPSPAQYPERIQLICAYIAGHYQDPAFNAAAVAEHFDYNISYLSRTFSEATGLKLGSYITLCQLHLARELLSGSTASVGDIAARCGFSSSGTFIRAFRKHEGITPGEYRLTPRQSGGDTEQEA